MWPIYHRLSLTQQWITATLLALLPFVAAAVYAGWSLALQAQHQRSMVALIDSLNNLDAAVSTQVTDIERSARQYLLLRSPKFLELFEQNVGNLRTQAEQLERLWPQQPLAYELYREAVAIARELDKPPDDKVQESVLSHLQQANQMVRQFSAEVDAKVQQLLDEQEDQFNRVQKRLLLIGALAVPGTVLLVVLASVAVARPMWRLAHAIRELGRENWQSPIEISGPSDLVLLGQSLDWTRKRLVNSEKQKRAFLRHITHELKTPLAGIVEAGALLRDEVPGAVNDAQQQVLQILLANADNLQDLIQQLLNYNAVAHGMLNAAAEVDIYAICHRIKDKLRATRPHSHCQWSISGEPTKVQSDPQAMDMILSNLLSNAHDFTPNSGKVAVAWGRAADHWWLTVSDNGPGMTPEERENIFKPFFQGRARRQGPLKGTGLGLAIVQECVAHLDGSINVKSDEGGSEFELRFPLGSENKP